MMKFLVVYTELKSKYEVTNKGSVDDYLGVKVEIQSGDNIKLSQPLLTQQIL